MTAVEVKVETPRPKPWSSVSIGHSTYRKGVDFVSALRVKGCIVDARAREMLRSSQFVPSLAPAQLVGLTKLFLRDLGFKEKRIVDLGEVLLRAEMRGLGLCPHCVAPEKCLQRSNLLPKGQKLFVAMKPIEVSSLPLIFVLSVDDARQYRLSSCSSRILMPDDELLFVQL